MFEFKFTLDATPAFSALIRDLIGAVTPAADSSAAAPATPAQPVPPVAVATPVQTSAPAPTAAAPAHPVAPASVNPYPAPMAAPAPAPAAVPVAPAPSYTVEQVSRAGSELLSQQPQKMNELLALLASYGVQATTDLKPEQLGPFATALRGMGAKL